MADRPGLAVAVDGGARPPLLEVCARAALIYVLPIAMVIANKSALAIMIAVACFCFLSFNLREGAKATLTRIAPAPSLERNFVAAFILLEFLSLAWSVSRADTMFGLGESLLALAASIVVAKALPNYPHEKLIWHLSIALTIAAALILLELALDMPLRRLLGTRLQTWQYNRAIEVLALFSPPLLLSLGRGAPALTWLAMAMVAAAALASDSGSGVLALAVATATMLLARWRLAFTRRLGLAAALMCLIMAPFIGQIGGLLASKADGSALSRAHLAERVAIWNGYAGVVTRHPVAGVGFATSATVGGTQFLSGAPLDFATAAATHPHNVFLQIWVELGAAGALIAGGLLIGLFLRIQAQPPDRQIASLTLFSAVAAIALVSHGAWQGWWLASAGGALGLQMLLWRSSQPAPA